ncbi:hypothetical protein ACK2M2_13475 [Acinetobacter sp. TY1]|uniref:hypothetical protein n=1 Tax=Acinetobacter sp. TY1 TaxID=3387626 RepID=UPI003AF77528
MATDVDVQFFSHLNGLTLGNNWGDMIRLLDTCLVNGLPLTSITSASIDTQGDITLNLYADHKSLLFQIIELSGFEPASINGKYRIKGAPSTTKLILKATHAGKTVSKIGTAKLASLGYDIAFRDSADVKRAYRAKKPRAEHPFIRVDESVGDGMNVYDSNYAKYAMVGLVEDMTHIDDYQNPSKLQLPLDVNDFSKNWKVFGTSDRVVRGWCRWHWARSVEGYNFGSDAIAPANGNRAFTISGDLDAFYIFNSFTPAQGGAKQLLGCGLFESSLNTSVVPGWFILGPAHVLSASTGVDHTTIAGGWPLLYSESTSQVHVNKYDIAQRIKTSVLAKPILPDYKSGRSGIYKGTNLAALQIPIADSDLKLRGTLKHIYFAGDERYTNLATNPILSDSSMYVYDGTPNTANTGGMYFYLGELE